MSNEQQTQGFPAFKLRYSQLEQDFPYLSSWLADPAVQAAFPCGKPAEIADSARFWLSFSQCNSSLTATVGGEPCAVGTLVLMPYEKIAHHCLLSLIVAPEHRGKGIGTLLTNNLLQMAKTTFKLESVCLEVYQGNPAIRLYERFLFQETGRHLRCLKYNGEYFDKIFMERRL